MDCELPDADDVGIQPLDELELPADDLGAIGSNPATAQPCRGKKRQKALLSKNVILLFFRSESQGCQDCQHPVRHATRMLQKNVLHRPMEVSLCDEVELPDDDVKLVEKDQPGFHIMSVGRCNVKLGNVIPRASVTMSLLLSSSLVWLCVSPMRRINSKSARNLQFQSMQPPPGHLFQ